MVMTIKDFVPDVNCQYGAPMGRTTIPPYKYRGYSGKAYLRYIPFVDYCYDVGGAYWGTPANLYCLMDEDGGDKVYNFYRASNREEAKQKARKDYPDIKFFR